MKALEYIQKKHLIRCIIKNGAAGKKRHWYMWFQFYIFERIENIDYLANR